MSTIAIVMMVVALVVIWGGLSVLRLPEDKGGGQEQVARLRKRLPERFQVASLFPPIEFLII